ncbi:hypothetical protein AB0M20_22180, partial [Actinoplanes sp. NPDC051633]|uniref:hypothetical protein n=1 Tax=Actinoplanes sp. NPDC051633 TaxID=3155670 RepID=UPI003449EA6E
MRRWRSWLAGLSIVALAVAGVELVDPARAAPPTAPVGGRSPQDAATAAAKESGRRVEVLSARTERQQVFANP